MEQWILLQERRPRRCCARKGATKVVMYRKRCGSNQGPKKRWNLMATRMHQCFFELVTPSNGGSSIQSFRCVHAPRDTLETLNNLLNGMWNFGLVWWTLKKPSTVGYGLP